MSVGEQDVQNFRDLNERRFWRKVKIGSDCWEWTAARNYKGYGQFSLRVRNKNHTQQAHRIAWLLVFGVLPKLCVLHHCDNPACCRPSHLFLGTNADNAADRNTKGRCRSGCRQLEKTHCKNGHEFSEENTRRCPSAPNSRRCKICDRSSVRRAYARSREIR